MSTGAGQTQLPAGAGLVLEFANSHAGGRPERFADARGLRHWLAEVGYDDDAVTEADAAFARELRDALQTLMLAHAGSEQTPEIAIREAERYLERVALRYPLAAVVREQEVLLLPTQTGMNGAIASLLADVGKLAQAGVWTRVKACGNPICHEAFFDRSRNASAIYHGPGCASMVSMRAYRQRKRSQAE
jgi:predicted RNA-binding Zn ribbon-like protein